MRHKDEKPIKTEPCHANLCKLVGLLAFCSFPSTPSEEWNAPSDKISHPEPKFQSGSWFKNCAVASHSIERVRRSAKCKLCQNWPDQLSPKGQLPEAQCRIQVAFKNQYVKTVCLTDCDKLQGVLQSMRSTVTVNKHHGYALYETHLYRKVAVSFVSAPVSLQQDVPSNECRHLSRSTNTPCTG